MKISNFKLKIVQSRVRIKIYGQVQGVFFRRSAKLEAERLGIVGWVRNNSDGFVEVMAQGSKEKVQKFIAWCKKGPPFAKVKNVGVEWEKDLHDFENFSIHD